MRVELFGVLRHRAGVDSLEIEAMTLSQAVREVCRKLPQLDGVCDSHGQLTQPFLANVNGMQFVVDPATPLAASDSLLLLSSDPGG
jgi:molybdopterin converting factor small subunit